MCQKRSCIASNREESEEHSCWSTWQDCLKRNVEVLVSLDRHTILTENGLRLSCLKKLNIKEECIYPFKSVGEFRLKIYEIPPETLEEKGVKHHIEANCIDKSSERNRKWRASVDICITQIVPIEGYITQLSHEEGWFVQTTLAKTVTVSHRP